MLWWLLLLAVGLAQEPEPPEPPAAEQVDASTGAVLAGPDDLIATRMRPAVKYPKLARKLGILAEVTCKVRVTIDEYGRPTDVEVFSCPKLFRWPISKVLWKWRWTPVDRDNHPVQAWFVMGMKFTPWGRRSHEAEPVPWIKPTSATVVNRDSSASPELANEFQMGGCGPTEITPVDPDAPEPGDAAPCGVRAADEEIRFRQRQPDPVYPEKAAKIAHIRKKVVCRIRVNIDESGSPYRIDYLLCPLVFQSSIEEAVSQWRWAPVVRDGQPMKAWFLMAIAFVP